MTQHFHVLLEWDPEASAWVTYVPALNGLSTFGDTKEEALAATREAIAGYVEAAEKEGIPLPEPTELVEIEVATRHVSRLGAGAKRRSLPQAHW